MISFVVTPASSDFRCDYVDIIKKRYKPPEHNNDIKIVDNINDADYQIAINSVDKKSKDARTLLFSGEPPCLIPESRWQNVDVYKKYPVSEFHSTQGWGFQKDYLSLKNLKPVTKSSDLSWIVSDKGLPGSPPWYEYVSWYRRWLINHDIKKYQYKHIPLTKNFMSENIPGSDLIYKSNQLLLNNPTDGHIQRMYFFQRVLDEYPELIDLYGKGRWNSRNVPNYNGFLEDRWDGLADYRYALAIHNYRGKNYFDKLTEPLLAWCMPITWGCTNLDEYFPEDAYIEIDIEDKNAPQRIREIVESDRREQNLDAIAEARQLILDRYQLWPTITNAIEKIESEDPVMQ
jgi:hypothetical protein